MTAMSKILCDPRFKVAAGVVGSVAVGHWVWNNCLQTKDAPSSSTSSRPVSASASQGPNPEDGIWIYFGSQSGTAQGFAEELEQEAGGHGLSSVHIADLEDFDPDEFAKHKVVVLLLATYGEGDPADNSIEFFKWLKDEDLSSDTLAGMQFTVMGLGNRQYVHFNQCAKDADVHMERVGATRIYEKGEGDDDQDICQDFEMWKEAGFWKALQNSTAGGGEGAGGDEHVGMPTPEEVVAKLQLRSVVYAKGEVPPTDPMVQVGGADVLGKWYFHASRAPVSVTDELRQVVDLAEGKTTKHMEFDIGRLQAISWQTADNLEVLPQCPDDVIDWFANRLGVQKQLDDNMTFVRVAGVDKTVKKPFPTPCSVRTALKEYCDLCAAPSRGAARKLAGLATDEDDRAALEKLLEDRAAYSWLTGDDVRLSLQEFFELFLSSAEIDISTFVQICPRQKSRPYTIASSRRENSKRIGICVSMVQERLVSFQATLDGLAERGHEVSAKHAAGCLERLGETAQKPRTFKGNTSTMLTTAITRGDKLLVFARPSSFRLPKRTTTPIIMIAAGTGIAPMRAFVREFTAEKGIRSNTMLFFGCTNSSEDYLYRDEFKEALALEPPALTELVTAFSREQAHKIYVQHRVKERAEDVKKLIGEGAYVYVCGANSMGASVRDALAEALGSPDHVSRLQVEGRYIEELW